MTPGDTGGGAGLGDAARKHGVAVEAIGLVELTSIDVGLAGVAGGVDEESGFISPQRGQERRRIGVVQLGP